MTDAEFVREIAQPLSGHADDYDPLLQFIGDARVVLLGEATHGTDEFYSERATISKRLIAEKGFSIVVIEADWPDSARVHRYVRGATGDATAEQALSGFRRFPTWMWRNTVVMEFVGLAPPFQQEHRPKTSADRILRNGPLQPTCLNPSRACLS
jgi:erythromycin esterase-like protein